MWRSLIGRGSLVALVVLVVVVIHVPAAWVADRLVRADFIRLVHPAGTLWRGSAFVAVSDGERAMVLPGRLAWQLDATPLLEGRVALSLEHPGVDNPVRVTVGVNDIRVEAGAARWPAALLTALGTPFNTLRPGGDMRITWSTLQIRGNSVDGRAEIIWADVSSALTPVAPLGRYHLAITARGPMGEAQLRTLEGPLLLEGRGTMNERTIRFSGAASAAPDRRETLGALLGVLGKRMGDKVLLDWELRR